MAHQYKYQSIDCGHPRILDEGLEMMGVGIRITALSQSGELAEQGIYKVIQSPAAHDDVVAEDKPSSKDAEFTNLSP